MQIQFLTEPNQTIPNVCAKGHTHISIVTLHVTAVAVLVPIGSLQAFLEIVPGQAAVHTETCWAAVLQMVSSCTQTARGNFLWRNKNRVMLSDNVSIDPSSSAVPHGGVLGVAGWALGCHPGSPVQPHTVQHLK